MTGAEPSRARLLLLRWPGPHPEAADWHARFATAIATAPGFRAIEIEAEDDRAAQWRILERFDDAAGLAAWRGAATRRALLAEAVDRGASHQDDPAAQHDRDEPVTEVVATHVPPGQEARFHAWCAEIQAAQGRFAGYRGTSIHAPAEAGAAPWWTTTIRFGTAPQLDAWLASPERAALLRRADRGFRSFRQRRLPDSFAAWFPGFGEDAPPLWKQAALVLLVLYPVVMLEMRFLSPRLAALPPALATFLGNALSVGLVTWPLMPIAVAAMGWWLHPRDRRAELLGLLLLLLLYAGAILLLARL